MNAELTMAPCNITTCRYISWVRIAPYAVFLEIQCGNAILMIYGGHNTYKL